MVMEVICIHKDLFGSRNLDWCEKYLISQIRYGNERFGAYTVHSKKLSEFSNYAFDEEQIKFCYEKLVAAGIIETKEINVELEGREPFKSHEDKIDEVKLKKIL